MKFAEEKAVVSDVEGEFVLLETHNSTSCSSCSSKSGCGKISAIFNYKPKNKLKLSNTLNLKTGDEVIVSMPSDKLLKASVLMYLSPLLLLFFFSLLAKLFIGEHASIIMGVFGLFFGLLFVRFYSKNQSVSKGFEPKLLRKIIYLNPV